MALQCSWLARIPFTDKTLDSNSAGAASSTIFKDNLNKYKKEYFNFMTVVKEFTCICKKCGKEYKVYTTQKKFDKDQYTHYCSIQCRNSHTVSDETKRKIKEGIKNSTLYNSNNKLSNSIQYKEHKCLNCDNIITNSKKVFCCDNCKSEYHTKYKNIKLVRNRRGGSYDNILSNNDRENIIKEYNLGETIINLSKKYNVSNEYIQTIFLKNNIVIRYDEISQQTTDKVIIHNYDNIIDDNTKKQILDDYLNLGLSIMKLCSKYNIHSKSFISKIIGDNVRTVSDANKLWHKLYGYSEESINLIRQKRLQYMEKHPENTAWYKRTSGQNSYIEQIFNQFIEEQNLKNIYKIETEYPFHRFFIDFAFINEKVAIELDGRQHIYDKNHQIDLKKDEALLNEGWRILRLTSYEILNHFDETANKIYNFLNSDKLFESWYPNKESNNIKELFNNTK